MTHLTLQEVVDRINRNHAFAEQLGRVRENAKEQPHRPEFYVPRITRRLATLMFSRSSS